MVYRIATRTTDYGADDLSGEGAKRSGGRWNPIGVPAVYTSTTRALACLETIVHFTTATKLPLNRYLIELTVPADAWAARTLCIDPPSVGWDAEPPGRVSIHWGAAWLAGGVSLIADVPSVLVPEERNILINPAHADIGRITARMVRRWTYDGRLSARR